MDTPRPPPFGPSGAPAEAAGLRAVAPAPGPPLQADDFDAAVSLPFRMQPGLRPLPPGQPQLSPLPAGARHQREKLAVLACFAEQALLQQPGFDATAALHALAAHAAQEHPRHWAWADGVATAVQLGCSVHAASGSVLHPQAGGFGPGNDISRCLQALPSAWRLAGLLSLAFAEDFAVIDGHPQRRGQIPWMAVALPSFWAPEDKIGRAFTEVHGPVADNRLLLRAADALTTLVTSDKSRWERFVWTVTPHPRLHAHPARVAPGRWGAGFEAQAAWWRSERQTFIPVPGTQQAVFTIRIAVQPLPAVLAVAPGRAARLQAALASMSPAVLDYRGLASVREPLLRWLQAQA